MYKAVIFDLDGTLLNTIDDLAYSANAALVEMGYPVRGMDEYKVFVGNGFRNLIKKALPGPYGEDDAIVDKCCALFQDNYSRLYMNKTKPYEGICELVTRLRENNIPMAVDSNKREGFTINLINKFFLKDCFELILGEVPDRPKKPDPRSVNIILEKFGLPQAQVLFVGDTKVDIRTGKNSGLDTAGVLWGFRDIRELKDEGADHIISKPAEILRLFDYSL